MTAFVEVLQIECIVPRLVEVVAMMLRFPRLELDGKYDATTDEGDVNPTPESGNVELEINVTVHPLK
jgi:hypothetical protein